MSFKNYLEMSGIDSASTDHIEFKKEGNYLYYSFKDGITTYNVTFKSLNPDIEFQTLSGGISFDKQDFIKEITGHAFLVDFTGSRGFNTTNEKGGGATKIYSQVLLAIKKIIQDYNAKIILFNPREPAMNLIYTKFAKSYLSDWKMLKGVDGMDNENVFVFMRNSVFDLLSKENSNLLNQVDKNTSQHNSALSKVSEDKARYRWFFMNKDYLNGKIVSVIHNNVKKPAVFLTPDRDLAHIKTPSKSGGWVFGSVSLDQIKQANENDLQIAKNVGEVQIGKGTNFELADLTNKK